MAAFRATTQATERVAVQFVVGGCRFTTEFGQWGEGLTWWGRAERVRLYDALDPIVVEVGGLDTWGDAFEALAEAADLAVYGAEG